MDDDIWDEERDKACVAEVYANLNRRFGANQPDWRSNGFANNGRMRRNANRRSVNKPENKGLEFAIGSREVGRVIGSGGSKIKEFERISGTSIKVDTSGFEPVVKVYGPPESQKQAKQLIEDSLGRSSNFNSLQPTRNDEPFDWDKVREHIKLLEEERQERFNAQMPITRDFYIEHADVARMTKQQVEEIRASMNNIMISPLKEGDNRSIPNPVTAFEHAFEKYPEILRELKKQGFQAPSPIQCQAWPILLKGYDMVGIAQTGTGKTIAFLLPAFIHIENQVVPKEERAGPTCLILAPTRELALQILEESKKYKYRGIRSVCVYGGGNKREQIAEIKKGVEIVIATPGRLLDLISTGDLDLICVTYLVLDEADRMLDLGFEGQIKNALRHIRPDRQTIMTSATWPPEVQSMVDDYMNNPIQIHVGSMDLIAAHSVEQRFIFSDDDDEKRNLLFSFIEGMEESDKLLVFVERKAVVDDMASDIVLQHKIECASIHGDREQCDREQALEDFKTGYAKVLIATDVASRGLDVKDVTHVFNMNMPRDIEDYVHRIGRTGRAGKSGTAITIISRQDRRKIPELIKILEEAEQQVPHVLYKMAESHKRWLQNKPDYKPRRHWRN